MHIESGWTASVWWYRIAVSVWNGRMREMDESNARRMGWANIFTTAQGNGEICSCLIIAAISWVVTIDMTASSIARYHRITLKKILFIHSSLMSEIKRSNYIWVIREILFSNLTICFDSLKRTNGEKTNSDKYKCIEHLEYLFLKNSWLRNFG